MHYFRRIVPSSIIDGVRLCKAARYRYKNNNMEDLEAQLIEASKQNHCFKIIVTDGVFFSMDGIVADGFKRCLRFGREI